MHENPKKYELILLLEDVYITDNVCKLFSKFKYAFMKEVSLDNGFNSIGKIFCL